ncbi:MAG: hypothetical protein C0406_03260 [Sideroxydans sp.]|nr:hypothetical protein [Sideroxydans sp.]
MRSFIFSIATVLLVALATNANAAKIKKSENSILFGRIEVSATNDEWTTTSLKVKEGEFLTILVRDDNQIAVGSYLGATTANGTQGGVGALQMKIGTGQAQTVGSNKTVIASEAGTVKFKIYDTNYSDNSGKFEVFVIHIPAATFPSQPTDIAKED